MQYVVGQNGIGIRRHGHMVFSPRSVGGFSICFHWEVVCSVLYTFVCSYQRLDSALSVLHVYALIVRQWVCRSWVINDFVVIGLTNIDCGRLVQILSDALDGRYSMGSLLFLMWMYLHGQYINVRLNSYWRKSVFNCIHAICGWIPTIHKC